jgi:hypothetical protein
MFWFNVFGARYAQLYKCTGDIRMGNTRSTKCTQCYEIKGIVLVAALAAPLSALTFSCANILYTLAGAIGLG